MADLHPNCVLINSILQATGLPGRVRILDDAAATAVAAAGQLGVEVAAIVNSLIFTTAEHSPLLVLTSGGLIHRRRRADRPSGADSHAARHRVG